MEAAGGGGCRRRGAMSAALRSVARGLRLSARGHQRTPAVAAEVGRRLSPRFVHHGPTASAHWLSLFQGGEADDLLTFEEKWRIYKRGAHLLFRLTKAMSIIVASGVILKLSLNEVAALMEKSQNMLWFFRDNPPEASDEEATQATLAKLESVLAEYEAALKDIAPGVAKQMEDDSQ